MTIDLLPTIAGLIEPSYRAHRIDGKNAGGPCLPTTRRNLPRGLLLLLRKPVASGQQEKMEASFPPWLPNDG